MFLLALVLTAAAWPAGAEPGAREGFEVVIAAGKTRNLPIHIPRSPVRVQCVFQVKDGPGKVRVVLLRSSEAEKFRRGEAHRAEAMTSYGTEEVLSRWLAEPGDYELILDNRMEGRGLTKVLLTVEYLRGVPVGQEIRPASRARNLFALASVLFFIITAGPAAWTLSRRLRRR